MNQEEIKDGFETNNIAVSGFSDILDHTVLFKDIGKDLKVFHADFLIQENIQSETL